jgi:hypothetical protein
MVANAYSNVQRINIWMKPLNNARIERNAQKEIE